MAEVRALRWLPVWRRNLRVWRKLAFASLAGNFGEPLIVVLALGYGLGAMVGNVDGMPYFVFLASGFVCSSAMMTASFEGTYSAYSRMAVQRTWEAMITAPLEIFDVVLGEVMWAATKAVISAGAILVVAAALGAVSDSRAVLALPVLGLAGLTFGAMAMVVTSVARSFDFFLYYQTLCITPMFLLCGVFFPLTQMPPGVQSAAWVLPLTHAVAIVRPLVTGGAVEGVTLHLLAIVAWGAGALALAVRLVRRRLRD